VTQQTAGVRFHVPPTPGPHRNSCRPILSAENAWSTVYLAYTGNTPYSIPSY
jgi:hypothetical protein